jgi:hypothetical protein
LHSVEGSSAERSVGIGRSAGHNRDVGMCGASKWRRMITMSDKIETKVDDDKEEQADSNPDGTQKLEQLVFGADLTVSENSSTS